jgi:[acyl-carrier-protein] S-malonyltransferase
MGKDFYEAIPAARSIFDRADRLLGVSLSRLCFEGPETDLTRTANTQLAVFVMSLACLAALLAYCPQLKFSLACGLSLGEFTALVALESITFEDGLALVRKRGELMEEANRRQPGTMASIIGLSSDECLALCRETETELANLNSYEQMVISGPIDRVGNACVVAKTRGARQAIELKVGGAFHSSLMAPAQAGFESALRQVKIKKPKAEFIPNVTGVPISSPAEIRKLLSEQLTQPVQWTKTIESIADLGARELLEVGPGHVLRGLARGINSKLTVVNIEKKSDLDELKPILADC